MSDQRVGEASKVLVKQDESFPVEFRYGFKTLDQSSDLHLIVRISDDSGKINEFSTDISAMRAMKSLPKQKILALTKSDTGAPLKDWLEFTSNGFTLPHNVSRVGAFGETSGSPIFYHMIGISAQGSTLQLVDPSAAKPIQTLHVPVEIVLAVIKMDANQDGTSDWVFVGTDMNQHNLQISYADATFHPLWGDRSFFQYQATSKSIFQAIFHHSYVAPGSWISTVDHQLMPSFFANGPLPKIDNYDSQHVQAYRVDTHLYYLEPDPTVPLSSDKKVVTLRLRAVDHSKFRDGFDEFHVQGLAPSTRAEQKKGHLKVFASLAQGLDATIELMDIVDAGHVSVKEAEGWDLISVNGAQWSAPTADSVAYFDVYDPTRAGLAWGDASGKMIERTEFSFKDLFNPFENFVGSFDLPGFGKFWFLESNFDLVGYHQTKLGGPITQRTLPVERNQVFTGDQLSVMVNPVLVGTTEHPQPGAYIDSTKVRGDQIAIAVWNQNIDSFERPLRYSFQLPVACAQGTPGQLDESIESFAIPLICDSADQLEFRWVQP